MTSPSRSCRGRLGEVAVLDVRRARGVRGHARQRVRPDGRGTSPVRCTSRSRRCCFSPMTSSGSGSGSPTGRRSSRTATAARGRRRRCRFSGGWGTMGVTTRARGTSGRGRICPSRTRKQTPRVIRMKAGAAVLGRRSRRWRRAEPRQRARRLRRRRPRSPAALRSEQGQVAVQKILVSTANPSFASHELGLRERRFLGAALEPARAHERRVEDPLDARPRGAGRRGLRLRAGLGRPRPLQRVAARRRRCSMPGRRPAPRRS